MPGRSKTTRPLESTAAELRVYLLGPPRVEWAGQPLTIRRRLPRALLYRLAARPEPIPREQLCFQFWPDTPDAAARRNLTRQLTHLRRALPDPRVLRTSGDQVMLDPERVWPDTAAFEQLCAIPDGETRLLAEAGFLDALQQAVDLYRGPFLAGFSLGRRPEFEAWASMEQRALEHKFLETLSALIEGYSSRRAYDPAIACAHRYLATDDLAEDKHRRLIELYAAAGDRSAALRQYERCTEVLERELGVDPLPETRAVYEAVLAGKPSPGVAPVTEPTWTTLPGLDVPLVGRDRALRALEQAYARTHAGQGGVVLISGEAGIGKSRLMQEFATRLRGHALVLTGAGYADAQRMPYQPIAQALRSALNADHFTLDVQPIWLSEASRLLPELRALHPDLPPPMEAGPAEARARLFEALSQLTLGLASGWHPVLLCLDDLHWADGTTLDWLAHLGRQLRVSRLLVIGTYRREDDDAIRELRHGLTRLGVYSGLRLRALDVVAVHQLLQHVFGPVPRGEAIAEPFQQATGGNPFFLLETLRAFIEAGRRVEDLVHLEDLPFADIVRETVAARLGRISPKACQVLEAGAVLGPVFGFDWVYQTAGRGEMETMDSLDELVGRQLLVGRPEVYRFQHEIIRTAVYQDLSYGRRRLLHRRAGEALESLQPDDVVALAWHFERAEAGADKAVDYLLQAGDRARGLYAHQEAIDFYQRALAFLKEQGDYEQAARTLMKLGLTYHNAFDFRHARQAYDRGFALWQRAGTRQPAVLPPPAPHALRVDWSHTPTLDPTMALDVGSQGVIDQLFSGLMELTPELDVVPDVARNWEVVEGGRKYVFHLRDDAAWSDGTPVTAGDFEWAWKRLLDPATESPFARLLYDVKGGRAFHQGEGRKGDVGVRALGEGTLVVELEAPTGYFLQLLARCATYPVPRQVIEVHGEAWTQVENIATNGPFKLALRQRGPSMGLLRNPGYHGRFAGNVQRVELSLRTEGSDLLKEYEAGELDILGLGRPEDDRIRQRHIGEYVSGPFLQTAFVGFNVSRPPFDDVRVRRAFVLATDREALADTVRRGYDFPATGGFVPPGMPGHSAGIGLPYDPDQARYLLAEAGYPGGRDFPLVDGLTHHVKTDSLNEHLQAQWRENLGLDIAWEAMEWPLFLDRLDNAPPRMFRLAWVADYPDPDNFLRASPVRRWTRWRNEAYDGLVVEARQVMDQQERMRLYGQADRILVQEAAIVPLCYARLHLLVKPWVRKFPTSAIKWCFWKDVIIEPH